MTSIKANERQKLILESLRSLGRVTTSDIARSLNVSTVTVRADFEQLEREQALRRIRGGAIALRPSRYQRPLEAAMETRSEEKERIAAVAAGMVRNSETIIMDTGSTTAAIARALPTTLRNIAVVTNSLAIAQELKRHPGVTVMLTGGTLLPSLDSLVSPFGQLLLREVNADLAFMSCSGIDLQRGFTNGNWDEAEIKKSMIRSARRIVFVADSGKLSQVATARIADIAEADAIITDTAAPQEVVKELRQAGLEVILA